MPDYNPFVTGSPEWHRVHWAVRKAYGSASDYSCIECDSPAKEWSWEHNTDPAEYNNYWPMCLSCHRIYDMTDQKCANISAARIGLNMGHANTQGSKHGKSKLVELDVLAIRSSKAKRSDLALAYGVSKNTIDNIIRRESWRHI